MEQVPQERMDVLLGKPMYMALQREIAKVMMTLEKNEYISLEDAVEDTADDMRAVISAERDRILPAFQGQEVFDPTGFEDLITELAEKARERAENTKGEW